MKRQIRSFMICTVEPERLQILAPAAKHVIGVEIVEEAVEAAKENAQLNQLDNCDFIAGDVLKCWILLRKN